MYARGEGVAQDDAEATKWFRRAAEQNDANAQTILGARYEQGLGAPQDDVEAATWYRKAADQGDGKAQLYLGRMYYVGRGVLQDFVLAHMWLNLAASRLSGDLREKAARARDALSEMMTPVQRAEAQRFAREWKPRINK